ncbi:MAG: hypothetical protein ACN6N0_00075 [Microvirgula sp.]
MELTRSWQRRLRFFLPQSPDGNDVLSAMLRRESRLRAALAGDRPQARDFSGNFPVSFSRRGLTVAGRLYRIGSFQEFRLEEIHEDLLCQAA